MQPNHMLRDALKRLNNGQISLDEAVKEIEGLRIETIGDFARLDLGRQTEVRYS